MLYLQLHKIQHAQRHGLITFWRQNCNYLHVSRFPSDVTVWVYPTKKKCHANKSWMFRKDPYCKTSYILYELFLFWQ